MSLLPDGYVLRARRRQALPHLLLVVLLLSIAAGMLQLMRGDERNGAPVVFMVLWSTIWFLGSGALLLKGLRGLIRPPVFAIIRGKGIDFPSERAGPIAWSDILDIRLGPPPSIKGRRPLISGRETLVLHTATATRLPTEPTRDRRTTRMRPLADGTVEWILPTDTCPLSTIDLLARLSLHVPSTAHRARAASAALQQGAPESFWMRGGILGLVFVLVGLGVLASAGQAWQVNRDGQRWRPLSAIIESVGVERITERTGKHRRTYWGLHMAYRYEDPATRMEHRGADLHWRYRDGVEAFVRSKLAEFPIGGRVRIFFDPAHPERSGFTRPGKRGAGALALVGALFAGIGVFVLCHLRRPPTPSPAPRP